jgi:uncharacterized protein YndB with AHSA1/START domain
MVAGTSSGTAVVTLPTDTQILIEREFDAPRHLVYRAYTEPELIARWWSGKRGEVTNVEVDLRIGGTWRYVMTANEGFEVAFHGTFRGIVPNERIVSTEVFEGAPGAGEYPSDDGGVLTTTMFTEVDGRTAMTQVVECGSTEVRDAIIESGMEGGMQEAMDALEEVAVSLR